MKTTGTWPAINPSTPSAARRDRSRSCAAMSANGLQQLELDVSLYAPIRLSARTSGSSL